MTGRVRENIAGRGLITEGARVVMAVSGGVDSMVLLRVLRDFPYKLAVAHFNHRLRGEESDGDERFVQRAAEEFSLPFWVEGGDVRGEARERGVSIEMAARAMRHQFFARAAREFGAEIVALGHHADDQVETFWLRLLRGDVGAGLTGMQWRSRSPADAGIALVRPMLNVARSEIVAYAHAHGIVYRDDSSNRSLDHQRNRLRQVILPLLEEYQPQVRSIILRTIDSLSDEKEFIRQTAETANFAGAHPAVQREMLRAELMRLRVSPSFELIEALRNSEERVSVAPGVTVARGGDGRLETATSSTSEFDFSERRIDVRSRGEVAFGGCEFSWEAVAERGGAGEGVEYFDADSLGGAVMLRHWRPGDRYQPIGMATSIKVQDVFTNLKIPEGERRHRVLAATSGGEIFWIEGVRIAEVAKIGAGTRGVLRWCWRRPPEKRRGGSLNWPRFSS